MRTLNSRCIALGALLSLGSAAPAKAQAAAAGVITGLSIISYVWLSSESVARLSERGRPATTGDSLRVRTRDGAGELAGRLASVGRDSIALRVGDSVTMLSRDQVGHARVYAGNESKWAQGWAVGFAGGLAIGAISGNASGGSPPNCEIICPNRDQTTLFVGLFGAITGSVVGAGVGALAQGDHWRSVKRFVTPTEESRVGIAPLIGPRTLGARVQVAVR